MGAQYSPCLSAQPRLLGGRGQPELTALLPGRRPFASTFSTNRAKDSRNFEVVNRIHAQKQLDELHISHQDLPKPDLLSKAAQALGAAAVLVGSATISPHDATSLSATPPAKKSTP